MRLLADIGNTCVKIATADRTDIGEVVRYAHEDVPWAELTAGVEEVRLSVVGPKPEQLFKICKDRGVPLLRVREIATLSEETEGVSLRVPEALGDDRLAAIMGARRRSQGYPVLVVDSGTCLTTDLVSAGGEHLGGVISPGYGMRLESMHEHTVGLPRVEYEGESPLWALTTDDAMRGGAYNGLLYEIAGYVRAARERVPNVRVYYTGGMPLALDADVERCPNLVLEGLL